MRWSNGVMSLTIVTWKKHHLPTIATMLGGTETRSGIHIVVKTIECNISSFE